jgi:hypothetical protein
MRIAASARLLELVAQRRRHTIKTKPQLLLSQHRAILDAW